MINTILFDAEAYKKVFEEAEKNREWFNKNRRELLDRYLDEFIFICEQRIIDNNKNVYELLARVSSEYIEKEHSIEYLTKEKIKRQSEKKKISRAAIIDKLLVIGGKTKEQIIEKVLRIFPGIELKKIRLQVYTRMYMLRQKGYKVINRWGQLYFFKFSK